MTLGSHQKSIGDSQTYLTPPSILGVLGRFDLDPATPPNMPWRTADTMLTENEDGLTAEWHGRVFLNPPFDRRQIDRWVNKMALHGNGILLVHARTETAWFQTLWAHASAIMFLDSRVNFHRIDGTRMSANSGAPVVLVAFGADNVRALEVSGISGNLVREWSSAA